MAATLNPRGGKLSGPTGNAPDEPVGQPRRKAFWREWAITLPSLGWLTVFFLVPTLMVFAMSFRGTTTTGMISSEWTLKTWREISNPNYPTLIWRTVWLSVAATVASIALAVPVGYYMARATPRLRAWLLLLVVVPFWTNFLIRVYAWRVVVHVDGYLHKGLEFLRLIDPGVLMNGPVTVLVVLVYSYLPFAILPVYAAAEKFDFNLMEAARDLGATSFQAFMKVFLPGIRRGVESAALMVLIPCLGAYVIPDLMGGKDSDMLGTKIYQRTFNDHNIPHASALAAILTLAVVVLLLLDQWRKSRAERAAGAREDSVF